jgi:hypothetical protein
VEGVEKRAITSRRLRSTGVVYECCGILFSQKNNGQSNKFLNGLVFWPLRVLITLA